MTRRTGPPKRKEPPAPPGLALVLGAVLTFLGAWALTEEEIPRVIGLALSIVGVAFLLTGAIAKGVHWGLDIRDENAR